jgi:hypothetical protein
VNLETAAVQPRDVELAAAHVVAALEPALDTDWTVRAGAVDWDVRTTLLHAAASVTYYAGHLASESTARLPLTLNLDVAATNEQILRLLPATARMLAIVAAASPDGARGFHEGGMADASGFVAMAMDELIVHGADAATGLGLSYDPPEQLARKVVDRLFPWAPDDVDGWTTLLWANGRVPLPGQPRIRPNWSWQCAPLDEWEGDIRFHRRLLPESYTWDETERVWRAVP